MNTVKKNKNETYHSVLQKLINLILFGKLRNPTFSKNKIEHEIHQSLFDFFQLLQEKEDDERTQYISHFFDEILAKFHKKIKDQDLLNLMNCFGFSNFRFILNLFRMFGSSNSKYAFDPIQKDSEIISDLIWSEEFPDEIRSYLYMQFCDLFNHLKHDGKSINKEDYQFLIDRYVGEYDYNKVINIIYQKFDDVD